MPLADFVIDGIPMEDGTYRGGPIVGSGKFMPEFTSAKGDPETGQGGHPNVHYTVGAAGCILEVDRETGKMKVRKAALAVDVGKAINPTLIKGQITGGRLAGAALRGYHGLEPATLDVALAAGADMLAAGISAPVKERYTRQIGSSSPICSAPIVDISRNTIKMLYLTY